MATWDDLRLVQAAEAASERGCASAVDVESLVMEVRRLKEALRLIYGYAAAIQRMSVFAPIGFRCSLIQETVSRALPDDEAKRLHDETQIVLDTFSGD